MNLKTFIILVIVLLILLCGGLIAYKYLDSDFEVKELLVPVFKGGELVYECPDLKDVKAHCADSVAHVWEEVLRFENPHRYYVDLSPKLWELKNKLLEEYDI